jgi:hypothetical protein
MLNTSELRSDAQGGAFLENRMWGRQSCLRTRFQARPGAAWKAGGSQDWLPH